MARDKVHKHLRVRTILEDGKWHSLTDLAKAVGTTSSNIHMVVGKLSSKELDFRYKWENGTHRKYVRLVNEDMVKELARQNPGLWGQLFWSTE